ncbi:relaxosome protein TraM [Klebsiella oxytoca]|uniref:conjugal transfer relaxosome DNA-binding protein TraM n=1 Tax=Klebsiella TaxID=570 RepID=UPI001CCB1150|nr:MULTISPECIES: conjugal transfer relaxosome DNA-binding protein TraM [Klebsiella]HBT5885666.1 relaxosome protein TraM [Klebsiella pneumoniae]EHG8285279.1 relaxosome protein TraM [Klebsiella oxytoca]MBZ7636726.1 relaxosome protein TraM [Klebsiella oxytoca]WKK01142.1 conjugal transfer relaxosome DNA-binding protein TraM [Klebsiella michiganensis]WKK03877.1 conjugal transfer relaxosome DNA-binding protein TraM [Klebsiella michiganensis]
MARVQAYASDEVAEKINSIVEKRRAEGAKEKDVSFSSVASMLLELGLRVYEAQMERKESGFNQTEFNKLLLENVLKTQFTISKVLAIESLSPHIKGDERFDFKSMVMNIRDDAKEVMDVFFPDVESERNE